MSSFFESVWGAATSVRSFVAQSLWGNPAMQRKSELLRIVSETQDLREKFNFLWELLNLHLPKGNLIGFHRGGRCNPVLNESEENLISWMDQLVQLANTYGSQYLVDESGQPSLERLVSSFKRGGDPTPFWLLMAYRRCYLAGNEEWQQKFFQEGTQQNEWRQLREDYRQRIIALCGGEEAMKQQLGSPWPNGDARFVTWLGSHEEGQIPPSDAVPTDGHYRVQFAVRD